MEKFLKRGRSLFREGDLGTLWRIEQGAVLLQKTTHDGVAMVQLALPGDILGLEGLCNKPYTNTAVALIDSTLSRQFAGTDGGLFAVVAEAYLQQQQRMHDMSMLRTGTVASRLRHLLALLSRDKRGAQRMLDRSALPTLREMAQIIDIADETICRELKKFYPKSEFKTRHRSVEHHAVLALAA